jgi:hypothetical protein
MEDSMHDQNGAYDTMQLSWCNVYTIMHGLHYDAKMTMLAMYAHKKCIKYDAYRHELMMHMTHTLQPFSRN